MKTNSICLALFLAAMILVIPKAQASTVVMALKVQNKVSIMMDSNSLPEVTTYYSCDALVDKTEALLMKLGATNISVNCMGDGDDETPTFSPSLDIKFSSIRLPSHGLNGQVVPAVWTNVSLKDSSDCESTRQLLAGLAPSFELGNFAPKSCDNVDSSYSYDLTTLVHQ